MKKKLFSLLVLLMTAVSGAWAETSFVVKKITANSEWASDTNTLTADDLPGFKAVTEDIASTLTGMPTTVDVGVIYAFDGSTMKFKTYKNGQFYGSGKQVVQRKELYDVLSTIDYYYTAAPEPGEVTWNAATMTGTFLMPGYDVELEVAYFNITAPTANTTDGDIHAGTATPLINAGSTTEEGATIKYLVTATNEQPTSTDGFSATVPTAEAITAPGTYYVWYYLDFATGDDSDISAQAIQVTVADYLDYTVSLAKGTEDAGKWDIVPTEAKPGTEITATYTGTKRVKSVRAVKKPEPKAAAEATAEDKDKLIGADGKIYDDAAAATAKGTTAVAKIIYIGTTGHATYNHGLALALTDEASTMAWQAAIDACSAKNTSTPVTDATWLLASKDQWNYMKGINGAGSASALRTGFEDVSGTNMVADEYWSSTEDEDDCMWVLDFNMGVWNSCDKSGKRYVRSALAF